MIKKKVLFLASRYTDIAGHAYSIAQKMNKCKYETDCVYLFNPTACNVKSFRNKQKLINRFRWKLLSIFKSRFERYFCFSKTHNTYLYNITKRPPYSAKKILEKYGDIPDIICITWISGFINAKTIYDLYKQTKAQIVLSFIDEAHLTGGCHYPNTCDQYLKDCSNCPALKHGFKQLASNNLKLKKKYLSQIPLKIIATTYDCNLAKQTSFLSHADFIPYIDTPQIPFRLEKKEARKKLNLSQDDFIIFFGAVNVSEKRKGVDYLKIALEQFEKIENRSKKVTLYIAGATNNLIINSNYSIITAGYIDLNDLFTVFYAADIFISPSIADSGPYMVNYSIACGTPVIAFPIGCALDLVKHKETGYLAKLMDAEDLANGILYFYSLTKSDLLLCQQKCFSLIETYRKSTPNYEQL